MNISKFSRKLQNRRGQNLNLCYLCKKSHTLRTINPSELPIAKLFSHLTGAVGPRPIAFASTVNAQGQVNLAPFSFFNVLVQTRPYWSFRHHEVGVTIQPKTP